MPAMSTKITNPLNKEHEKLKIAHTHDILDMHSKIKRNNPIRSITEHIGNKVYPRAKVKLDLPKGW